MLHRQSFFNVCLQIGLFGVTYDHNSERRVTETKNYELVQNASDRNFEVILHCPVVTWTKTRLRHRKKETNKIGLPPGVVPGPAVVPEMITQFIMN